MKYEEFAEQIGFTLNEGVYEKKQDGYTIYLKDWQYIIMTIKSFYIPLDTPLNSTQIKEIEKATFNTACSGASIAQKNDELIITLPEGDKKGEKFKKTCSLLITKAIEYLKDKNIGPMKNCPFCNKEADEHRFIDNFLPLHEECKQNYKTKLIEKVNKQKSFTSKNILSLFLSLIGGIIGALPAILLAIFAKGYFGGVIVLIPLLVFLGFFLSKSPNAKWLVIVTSLLSLTLVVATNAFTLPYMAKAHSLTFFEYCFKGKWVGFKKIIFSTLFAFVEFGLFKYYAKFKPNFKKMLDKID